MSDYIPEDIQFKILKHLPIPTLLRSRCVCKWWKQFIDSQSFIQDHLTIQKKPYLIVEYEAPKYLVADPCELPSFNILPSPIPERLRLLGTLHGIICLYDEYWCNYVLWNPSICKLMRVSPIGPTVDWYDYDIDANLVGPCCGFWIDPLTKEFRIIKFRLFDNEEVDDVGYVYSSVRGDWKEIPVGEEFEYYYTKEVAPAVMMDNVGHWTIYNHYFDKDRQSMVGVVVLSFDFMREIFLEPIDAFSINVRWNRPVLCNCDGALSLVYMVPDNLFDVFSWKEGEWVRVHSFCLFHVVEKFMRRGEYVEEEAEKVRVLATITGGLLSFDSEDMIFCGPLMMEIRKADEVVIANGFVTSLLFPATD